MSLTNSSIVHNSDVYFAVRKLTSSADPADWHWHWITYSSDAPGAVLSITPTGTNAAFDPKTIVPPSTALFRMNLDVGTYSPSSVLEDQGRFTLTSPAGRTVCVGSSTGQLVLTNPSTQRPVIWSFNSFDTLAWDGIVDFGMRYTTDSTLEFPLRAARPVDAYSDVLPYSSGTSLANNMFRGAHAYFTVADDAVKVVSPARVSRQVDLGTLNFRVLHKSRVIDQRLCDFTNPPRTPTLPNTDFSQFALA
jgi:hypothetical protein